MVSMMMHQQQSPEEEKLYETCLKGSKEDIRNIFRNGGLSTHYLKDGLNPTHVIAIAERKDAELILEMMLQNGFDVNSQTRSGDDSVLHLIIQHIDVKEAFPLVLKILEYNPDLSIRNKKLRTPYDLALAKGEFELAEVLEGTMSAAQAREFYTQKIGILYGAKLVDAVVSSREQDMKDFINLGADPNYVNEHKNGAIHYAITHCKILPHKTLTLLIQAGADVNLQDDEGDTALNLVIKSARLRDSGEMFRCAELLVQHGAMSTFKDLDGYDGLALAKRREYADIVALLQNNRQRDIQDPLPSFTETHDDFVHPPSQPPQPPEPPEPFTYLQLPENDQEDRDDVTPEPEDVQNATPRGPSQNADTPRTVGRTPRRSITDPSPIPGPSHVSPSPAMNRLRPTPRSPPPPFPAIEDEDEDDDEEEDDDEFQHPGPGRMNDRDMSQHIMNDIISNHGTFREVSPEDTLTIASETGMDEQELVALEEQHDIPTETETESSEMVLIRATRQGTVADVENALHVLRAEVNVPDDTGIYPIHHVCIRGEFQDEGDRTAMLQALYEAGADINMQTVNSESTALHVAATNNQDHVAKWLLDTHKCDYNLKNKEGLTPYEVAEQEECQEVMDVIDKHRKAVRDRMKKTAKASTCTLL